MRYITVHSVMQPALVFRRLFLFAIALFALSQPQPFTPKSVSFTPLHDGSASQKRLLETMSGGVAVTDFNNDGLWDVFLTNGADPRSLQKTAPNFWNRAYLQTENGSFQDATEQLRLQGSGHSIGVAAADFDNDGDTDLFVTGVPTSHLYRNDRTHFTDITMDAGLSIKGFPVGAAWLDYDRDGLLDLFVVNYVRWNPAEEKRCTAPQQPQILTYCHPSLYAPSTNFLFRNMGEGRFQDVSKATGISAHAGKGMAAAITDLNNDGRPDIAVTNDTMPNFLFESQPDGTFRETAVERGLALNDSAQPVSSMGAHFGDYNNDGLMDLIVTALANETFSLFRNSKATFIDSTNVSRLSRLTLPFSGWSVAWADFNNDSWLDLFTANGDVQDNSELLSDLPSKQPLTIFQSQQGRTFQRIDLPVPPQRYRGSAVADFNRDGRLDILASALRERPVLLLNQMPAQSWIAFHLTGSKSNRDALGARLTLTLESGRKLVRELTQAVGYASSTPPIAHFGLAEEKPKSLQIVWPSGQRQILTNLKFNAYSSIREPD